MIPYPPSFPPLPGCSACDEPYSHEQERCFVNGCGMELCPSCCWRCAECDRPLCEMHFHVEGGAPYCETHAAEMRQHYREMFDAIMLDYRQRKPCDCDGTLEDMTDPFVDRALEEDYGCSRCGQVVSKRLDVTHERLRELRAEGYGARWPEARYEHVAGNLPRNARHPAQRKVA